MFPPGPRRPALVRCKGISLHPQQGSFSGQPPGVASDVTPVPHDSMTRNDDRNRIATERASNGPGRAGHAEAPRELAIADQRAVRNSLRFAQHLGGKRRHAPEIDRDRKISERPGEIGFDLRDDGPYCPFSLFPDFLQHNLISLAFC